VADNQLKDGSLLDTIYKSREVRDHHGNSHRLNSEITRDEGELIASLIHEHGFTRTLEIGCAFGISSLFICQALSRQPSPHHTVIDPGQFTEWHGIGVNHLMQEGYDFYELIEKPSEIALPSLLEQGRTFQLALIDGLHTFDHVLLDFFYVDRLLEDGGIVVLDDLQLPAIRKAARYIAGYPTYKIVATGRQSVYPPSLRRRLFERPLRILNGLLPSAYASQVFDDSFRRTDSQLGLVSEMVAFQKTGPDRRGSHWFMDF
jgi:predicted O-methyltransferase YrrM